MQARRTSSSVQVCRQAEGATQQSSPSQGEVPAQQAEPYVPMDLRHLDPQKLLSRATP